MPQGLHAFTDTTWSCLNISSIPDQIIPDQSSSLRPSEFRRTALQGMLRGDELSAAYASADIFMMPSETETLGFVALEAMASGLAVVAVAAGGLVDIIKKPGITGAGVPF